MRYIIIINTLRPGWNGSRFADHIFNALSWMKIALITTSLKYDPRGPVSIKPAFVQIMTRHRTGNKPLSEPIPPPPPNLLIYWHIYASLDHNAWSIADLSGFPSGHRVALVVHRNLYPTRPVSDPHFRLRRWRAALGPLMLTVQICVNVQSTFFCQFTQMDIEDIGAIYNISQKPKLLTDTHTNLQFANTPSNPYFTLLTIYTTLFIPKHIAIPVCVKQKCTNTNSTI